MSPLGLRFIRQAITLQLKITNFAPLKTNLLLMKTFSFIILITFSLQYLYAQSSEILFFVDEHEITVDEFEYIYKKNNPGMETVDKADAREYLDLYVNFKKKVIRARELQIDTIPSLNEELEGYRRQLSRTFLMNEEINKNLVEELFERKQFDVNISHILIAIDADAPEETTQAAYEKINELRKKLKEADSFSEFAKEHSQDPAVDRNGGNIGYITAPLPDGFYELEKAAYSTPVGELSDPIRTRMGYHIVKVNDKRTARGEVEVAQILVRTSNPDGPDENAVNKISDAITQLQKGESFEDVARSFSEDASTAARGGYIGFIGINMFDRAFEDAAFALANDGDYSPPIRSRLGYHIIQRISRRPIEDFDQMKPLLTQQIENSERKDIAMENLVNQILDDAEYSLNEELLSSFIAGLTDEFFTYRWRVPEDLEDGDLFTLGDKTYMLSNFAEHLRRNTRQRLRMSRDSDIDASVREIYESYRSDAAIIHYESTLEEKYPVFRSLMREYEEGILLFEITRMKVWDKATQDTAGLKNFFNENRENYYTDASARVKYIDITGADERQLERIANYAKNNSVERLINRFEGRRGVSLATREITYFEPRLPDYLEFWDDSISEIQENENGEGHWLAIIKDIIPPQPRTLEQARGFVIADYQNLLEQQWMEELSARYSTYIDEDVFLWMVQSWKK